MYRVLYSDKSKKVLKRLDKQTAGLILDYMDKVAEMEEPRHRGKALAANLKGFWRYRVGNYRIICEIKDKDLLIIAVNIGHRSDIYRN